MPESRVQTLTDRKGMGGVIAYAGFGYQEWAAAARVPHWLANPAFEAIGLEMLEDFEATFFEPDAPSANLHRLERFQAKSATLKRAELVSVLAGFKAFAEGYSDTVRMQALITPDLPAELKWVVRDGFRVANARPFYHHYPEVMADSDTAYVAHLSGEFGTGLGPHLVRDIAIELVPHDEGFARAAFARDLHESLGLDWPTSAVARAFANVCTLLRDRRGSKVGRMALVDAISDGNPGFAASTTLRLAFVRGQAQPPSGHLGLDAEDGGHRVGAPAVPYTDGLQKALVNTAGWATGQGYRRVAVDAPMRLSAAFGLGLAFRPATVFDLDVMTPGGVWSTDAHPAGSNVAEWTITAPDARTGGRLAVVIGLIRDPVEDVRRFLGQAAPVLHLHLPRAVISAEDVQSSVRAIKDAVSAATARLAPDGIDLFYLGPAVLATALGHRWNALPPTCFFEHDRTDGYVPTVKTL
ncbi:SAVED domain-containing protein [Bacillus sp. NP157]|nr:SAVED domain-containing protein [Bacillus sp. NP157]